MKRLDKVGHAGVPAVPLVRDRMTVLLYVVIGVEGYLLNGLGPVLEPLQRQLGVSRVEVAFYPSLFALALVGVGFIGGRLIERIGQRCGLVASVVALAAGAGLLASSIRPLTVAGAALLGIGAALVIQLVPAELTRLHPVSAPAAIGEATAASSVAALVAPFAIAAAIGLGAGWYVGYTLPVLPFAAALLFLLLLGRPLEPAADRPPPRGSPARPVVGPGLEPGRMVSRWVALLIAVSAEFCLVFWAAAAFTEWHQAGPAAAPALAATFLAGMAVGRSAASWITTGRHPLSVIIGACAVAAAGFAVFWAAPGVGWAAAGLLVAGTGIALLYPVAIARLVASWPDDQDRAASRGALASGLAIGSAPLLLAGLADVVGLRVAYLIVPVLLVALTAQSVVTLGRDRVAVAPAAR